MKNKSFLPDILIVLCIVNGVTCEWYSSLIKSYLINENDENFIKFIFYLERNDTLPVFLFFFGLVYTLCPYFFLV